MLAKYLQNGRLLAVQHMEEDERDMRSYLVGRKRRRGLSVQYALN